MYCSQQDIFTVSLHLALGLEEEAKALIHTWKQQGAQVVGDKQEHSETVGAGSHVHNISVVGLEGKVASD